MVSSIGRPRPRTMRRGKASRVVSACFLAASSSAASPAGAGVWRQFPVEAQVPVQPAFATGIGAGVRVLDADLRLFFDAGSRGLQPLDYRLSVLALDNRGNPLWEHGARWKWPANLTEPPNGSPLQPVVAFDGSDRIAIAFRTGNGGELHMLDRTGRLRWVATGMPAVNALAFASEGLFAAGFEEIPGSGGQRWRRAVAVALDHLGAERWRYVSEVDPASVESQASVPATAPGRGLYAIEYFRPRGATRWVPTVIRLHEDGRLAWHQTFGGAGLSGFRLVRSAYLDPETGAFTAVGLSSPNEPPFTERMPYFRILADGSIGYLAMPGPAFASLNHAQGLLPLADGAMEAFGDAYSAEQACTFRIRIDSAGTATMLGCGDGTAWHAARRREAGAIWGTRSWTDPTQGLRVDRWRRLPGGPFEYTPLGFTAPAGDTLEWNDVGPSGALLLIHPPINGFPGGRSPRLLGFDDAGQQTFSMDIPATRPGQVFDAATALADGGSAVAYRFARGAQRVLAVATTGAIGRLASTTEVSTCDDVEAMATVPDGSGELRLASTGCGTQNSLQALRPDGSVRWRSVLPGHAQGQRMAAAIDGSTWLLTREEGAEDRCVLTRVDAQGGIPEIYPLLGDQTASGPALLDVRPSGEVYAACAAKLGPIEGLESRTVRVAAGQVQTLAGDCPVTFAAQHARLPSGRILFVQQRRTNAGDAHVCLIEPEGLRQLGALAQTGLEPALLESSDLIRVAARPDGGGVIALSGPGWEARIAIDDAPGAPQPLQLAFERSLPNQAQLRHWVGPDQAGHMLARYATATGAAIRLERQTQSGAQLGVPLVDSALPVDEGFHALLLDAEDRPVEVRTPAGCFGACPITLRTHAPEVIFFDGFNR